MDTVQAIWVAVLQGATEMFPVSSLGHAVVVPPLFGLSIAQDAPSFLPFLVMLHVGTALALLVLFWRDWWALLEGVIGRGTPDVVRLHRRLLLMMIVATIPAVVVGGVLEHRLRLLFATPLAAAGFLIVNGLMLIVAERLRGRATAGQHRSLVTLDWADAVAIGLWQCLALLPGLSRSGATIVGGLLRGFDHEAAARFSFLIAVPIILGATVLEVPKLAHADMPAGTLSTAILAAAVAGLTALVSTWLLMRLFRQNDRWSLVPFGLYCIALGAAALAVFGLR